MFELFPNPGVLPTMPPPIDGETISIRVDGLPPYKDLHNSIRNPKHRDYSRFDALRNEATKAMDGRAWSDGRIRLTLKVHSDEFDGNKGLTDYLGGVLDTLDGSHGESFTYLPICFQDDAQVISCEISDSESARPHYEVEIQFCADNEPV